MDEHIEVEVGAGLPERPQCRCVKRLALQLGGNGDAREAEVDRAALEFRRGFRRLERRHMGEPDEAAGIVLHGLLDAVIDQAAGGEVRLVEARPRGEHGGIDTGAVHHAHMGGQVGQQRVEQIVRIAVLIELDGHAVGLALEQFRRRVVMLEVDDHSAPPISSGVTILHLSAASRNSGRAAAFHLHGREGGKTRQAT